MGRTLAAVAIVAVGLVVGGHIALGGTASVGGREALGATAPVGCHARGHGLFSLPDPRCTPGQVNPAVTQSDISSTICRSGWTRTVRPPESVTELQKRASMAAYGDHGPLHAYEYDHLIPLELGGATDAPRNLWPEPGASPNPKDRLENLLRRRVCAGTLTLASARRALARNWVAAEEAGQERQRQEDRRDDRQLLVDLALAVGDGRQVHVGRSR
jgi:hypothetical protein